MTAGTVQQLASHSMTRIGSIEAVTMSVCLLMLTVVFELLNVLIMKI